MINVASLKSTHKYNWNASAQLEADTAAVQNTVVDRIEYQHTESRKQGKTQLI